MTDGNTTRVLVTGAAGMLGSQVVLDAPVGTAVIGTDLAQGEQVTAAGVDLTDPAALAAVWESHGPFTGVIHGAAFTAVDAAEEQEELALKVNADATRVIARACAQHGARLVAVGTDFVFDGAARTPYAVDAPTAPLSAYGRTKLAGEVAAFEEHPDGTAVVRTQWLYGPRGGHFPRTIVKAARERGALKVVDDQTGAPTTTLELSPALWDVLASDATGVFHAACEGDCTWFGFTSAILEECDLGEVTLEPCDTSAFPRPAARPAYSVLDSSRLAALRGRTLDPWRTALRTYLTQDPL